MAAAKALNLVVFFINYEFADDLLPDSFLYQDEGSNRQGQARNESDQGQENVSGSSHCVCERAYTCEYKCLDPWLEVPHVANHSLSG